MDGLFEVVPGIYQVRGFDLSNITFVEGTAGVLVIDPLISTETAAAALALYREHRGDRPVVGVIYTHSHVDHFGGVRAIVSEAPTGRAVFKTTCQPCLVCLVAASQWLLRRGSESNSLA